MMNAEIKIEKERDESTGNTTLKKNEEQLSLCKRKRDVIFVLVVLFFVISLVWLVEDNQCVQKFYWISISIIMSGIFVMSLDNFPLYKYHSMLMIFIGIHTLPNTNTDKYNTLMIMISLFIAISHVISIFWKRIYKMSWKVGLFFIIIYFISSLIFCIYSHFHPSEKINAVSIVVEVLSQLVLVISYDLMLLYIAMHSRTSVIE